MKSTDEKGASFSVKFKGTQIGLYGMARPDGGYARVVLLNSKGKTVTSSVIEMYRKYPVKSLLFLSPSLPKNNYTMTVTVLGERWYWVEKSGRIGSKVILFHLIKL